MSDVFARAGEAVTTPDGKVICRLKNDLRRFMPVKAEDFHEFADSERPWVKNTQMDPRCVRSKTFLGGMQICINGEWRP